MVSRTVKITVELADGEAPDMTMKFGKMVFAPRRLIIDWRTAGGDWGRPTLKASGPQRLKSGGLSAKNTAAFDWWDSDTLPEWATAILAVNHPAPISTDDLPPEPSDEIRSIDLDGVE